MTTGLQNMLGNGIYTVAEAALYARVTTSMMSRWLFGTSEREPVIVPQFKQTDKLVSFLDLVQTLAIREIQIQRKISLQKFRQAIKLAKNALGMDYPFAMKHTTYLWGDELVIRQPGQGEFIEVSGKHRGQKLFNFVETYLENLTFDANGIANRYQIFRSNADVSITMDPHFRFGEPLLPSKYSALTIFDAIRAEDGIEPTVKAYGIPREEVEAAYNFVVNYLGKTAA